ncbi:hypothetical protein BJX66DRAFT_319093 [Aspergillus keveii]|uniref:Uncharacterized protein n=1 Tax=Aspergillus keveii TaxID=714993 RepID=A0ABR4FIS5_9EURO
MTAVGGFKVECHVWGTAPLTADTKSRSTPRATVGCSAPRGGSGGGRLRNCSHLGQLGGSPRFVLNGRVRGRERGRGAQRWDGMGGKQYCMPCMCEALQSQRGMFQMMHRECWQTTILEMVFGSVMVLCVYFNFPDETRGV